jgi:predicted DNA-binding protein
MTDLHPRFVTDADGRGVSVLLPLAEYEALIERLQDMEDLAEARAVTARVQRGEEETVTWNEVKAELGL